MVEYRKMYTMLFNRITDAIELINKMEIVAAKEILIKAQQDAEEMYVECGDKITELNI